MKTSCAVCIVVFVLSGRSHADFGTQDDALQAALEDAEPTYIPAFMRFFSERLTSFAQGVVTESPEQRLAMLTAVEVLIRLAHGDATNAAQEAAAEANTGFVPPELYDAAGRAALNTGMAGANRALREAVRDGWPVATRPSNHASTPERRERRRSRNRADEVRQAAREAAQAAALVAVERAAALGATVDEIGRIAYRVAEREIMNRFARDLDWRLAAIYRTELGRMPEQFHADHPFVDVAAWPAFRVRHFEGRAVAVTPFLAPLGPLLDAWMNVPAALNFQMARHRPESLVHELPLEMVLLILTFVAPQVFLKEPTSAVK